MKKIIAVITAVALMLNFNILVSAEEYTIPETNAYVLLEAETGTVLYSNNENERFPISSLAKIMTLLIIAEELETGRVTPSDEIPVSANASGVKGSIIWLMPGEIMPLGELVKAVVISSANDATIALAEYVAGSAEEFTALMNKRASELGMNDTFFADCGGFDENSYSSAFDVSVMTAELFKYDVYGKFFTTRLSAVREGTELEAQLLNTNKLAHWYKGLLGGKAGQSQNAGFCLTNCARRDNMKLIAVVLGAKTEEDRVDLSEYLLDVGFKNFELISPNPDSEKFSPVKVLRGIKRTAQAAPDKSVNFVVLRGEGQNTEYEYTMPESVSAPVEKGQTLGKFSVRLGDNIISETSIIALETVEELTFKKSFEIMVRSFLRL
ncbi:MAG: D-alanyl-D-alanine carboxypeptidase [Oscillospiraceae bacterium]|nr:D-alanyl-D-alanine carboxypeptidase [Oscillospiraceae bacterium]